MEAFGAGGAESRSAMPMLYLFLGVMGPGGMDAAFVELQLKWDFVVAQVGGLITGELFHVADMVWLVRMCCHSSVTFKVLIQCGGWLCNSFLSCFASNDCRVFKRASMVDRRGKDCDGLGRIWVTKKAVVGSPSHAS